MAEQAFQGSCLCGAVVYEISLPFVSFTHCYCHRCRKASGTARATNIVVLPEQFRWLGGEDFASRWNLSGARSFATTVCIRCGCPVPHATRSGREIIVPAGSLDDDLPIGPSAHRHWASRAGWAAIDETELPCTDQ